MVVHGLQLAGALPVIQLAAFWPAVLFLQEIGALADVLLVFGAGIERIVGHDQTTCGGGGVSGGCSGKGCGGSSMGGGGASGVGGKSGTCGGTGGGSSGTSDMAETSMPIKRARPGPGSGESPRNRHTRRR
jgi:hypothetical protein